MNIAIDLMMLTIAVLCHLDNHSKRRYAAAKAWAVAIGVFAGLVLADITAEATRQGGRKIDHLGESQTAGQQLFHARNVSSVRFPAKNL